MARTIEEERICLTQSSEPPKINFRQRLAGRLEGVINSFRISPQLHYLNIALSSSLVTIGIFTEPGVLILCSLYSTINTLLTVAKTQTNYRNYERVREGLVAYGWDERIIQPMTYTLCSRNAARVAAIDAGYKKEITEYYLKEQLTTWCT